MRNIMNKGTIYLEIKIMFLAESKSALARKFGAGQHWNVGGSIKFS